MATSSELLTAVNNALDTRLTGGAVQSYAIRGVNISRDPLDKLVALRDKLRAEVAAANRGLFVYADKSGRVT